MVEKIVANTTHIIFIYRDDNPESPREWSNLGQLLSFTDRFMGDAHNIDSAKFRDWTEIEEHLRTQRHAELIYPLYLLDHGNIEIAISPDRFRACDTHGWDWGQIGFLIATREAIQRDYQVDEITPDIRQRAQEQLYSEVDVMNQYLQGDVYGYVCYTRRPDLESAYPQLTPKKLEEIYTGLDVTDSLWGLYGLDAVFSAINEEIGDCAEWQV